MDAQHSGASQPNNSFAGASERNSAEPEVVTVSAICLMKIFKHFQDSPKLQRVEGFLLGMEQNNTIQVTNCFPAYPEAGAEDYSGGKDRDRDRDDDHQTRSDIYLYTFQQYMRDLSVDSFLLGGYLVTWHGVLSPSHVAQIVDYVLAMDPKWVTLIFDPIASQQTGRLSVHAIRPRPEYLALQRGIPVDNLCSSAIFESLPVQIVGHTALCELACAQLVTQMAMEPLKPPSSVTPSSIRAGLSVLSEEENTLVNLLNTFQYNMRRFTASTQNPVANKAPANPPGRLGILHSVRHLASLSQEISEGAQDCIGYITAHHQIREALSNAAS